MYISSFLLCTVLQSCGEEEEPVFGSYLEIESGYKNCGSGPLRNQIEVLTDRGICWKGNNFSECFTTSLSLTPEYAFVRTTSGIRYYDNGSQEKGLQSESTGTFSHEGNLINLFKETNFGIDTTVLRIEMDGTLNTIDRSIVNCYLHGIYRKQE